MFIKLGGTANCNRYTCKEEGRSLGSTLENLENDKKLITSVNDMIEYLETSYTSKITNYFIADVRETVMSLLREMNEKNDMENRNKKVVGKFAKVGWISNIILNLLVGGWSD